MRGSHSLRGGGLGYTGAMKLLDQLWREYAAMNPQVAAIHGLLAAEGETIVNDHVALRTFGDPRVNIEVIARPFVAAGYAAAGAYRFAEKRLIARHFVHEDPALPLVFISELVLEQCSPGLRARVDALLAPLAASTLAAEALAAVGRPWQVSFVEVEALRAESEYAAWLACFGWRVNHFTVLTNALKRRQALPELLAFLEGHGFEFNHAGGAIKGAPALGLEQASTLASAVPVAFSDGVRAVPGCYYEFARRYAGADGRLFRGFIEGSADRLFESTHQR